MSETDFTISTAPNGRALNGSQKKATHVYRDWAKANAGKPVAAALHGKLKAVGIRSWPTGDTESMLRLAGDKSEAEWAEFGLSLEGGNLGECVAEGVLMSPHAEPVLQRDIKG
ncbi:MAG: hypothetical protein U9Q93_07040 [Pseudomonadota bacterium]|nr:hypothetical protein [Pseudomonadota bacterium]